MNIKIISVLGVMALMVAVWFFYQEDIKIKPAVPSIPEPSYEITQIKGTQTNAQTGKTEYTLIADSLIKNSQGVDEMVNAKIDWQPPQGRQYELTANRATLDVQTGELVLSSGFVLTGKGGEGRADMVITGNLMTGNTKTHTLSSNEPISVVQGLDKFLAQGFVVNLKEGEYEFSKIELVFAPPQRTDEPLFKE